MLYQKGELMSLKHIAIVLLGLGFCRIAFGEGPSIAPDNSSSSMDLISQGMPSFDRSWSAADYSVVEGILRDIAKNDATMLPRRNSAKSGTVFERIVSVENLISLQSETNKSASATMLAAYLKGIAAILQIYASATNAQHSYDAEVLDLNVLFLEALKRTDKNASELLSSLPQESTARNNSERNFERMKSSTSAFFGSILLLLGDHQEMRTSELVRFAVALKTYFSDCYDFILPGTQQEIRVRLKNMANSEKDEDLKNALSGILSSFPG
jgi:hypothetical protein